MYLSSYENHIIMCDFNVGPENTYIKSFCNNFDLKNLIKEPTCFKNPENPSCIDLILTNRSRSFQNSCNVETGLSDFHKMTLTVMKNSFQKYKPRIKNFGTVGIFKTMFSEKICYLNYSISIFK